jgi:[ribosomal protein S5]-alanine N-acetyltransferase
MSVTLPIETERLLIRSFDANADSAPMLGVYGDPDVMRFIPGGALADLEAVKALLERYANAHRRLGFSSWGLIERASDGLIGDVGFGIFEPTGDIELGYTLGRSHWGRGYATEAAGACLAAGLAQLSPERIIAVVDEANESSLRVAHRIGMRRVKVIELTDVAGESSQMIERRSARRAGALKRASLDEKSR